MTLIAFRVDEDRAEILTDTLSYANGLTELGRCSKVMLLPHLDAAVMTRGPDELEGWSRLLRQGSEADTLDDWTRSAADALPHLWAQICPEIDPTDEDQRRDVSVQSAGWVFHVGWSPARGRMVAYEFTSEDGWRANDVTDRPYFAAPDLEVPLPQGPRTDVEWLGFTDLLFQDRALAHSRTQRKGVFGGDLILTEIRQGMAVQRRIGTIATDSALFRQALIGTAHPSGQLGPCECGSGGPAAVCCPRYLNPDRPCMCGSGRPFGLCHRIDPQSAEALNYWADHEDDFTGPLNLPYIYERARAIEDYWAEQRLTPS